MKDNRNFKNSVFIKTKENINSIQLNYFWVLVYLIYFSYRIYKRGLIYFLYESIKYWTNWVVTLLFFYSLFRIIKKEMNKNLSILFNIIFCLGIFTSIFYWVILFPINFLQIRLKYSYNILIIDIFTHIIPIFYIILEFCYNKNIIFINKFFSHILITTFFYFFLNLIFVFIIKDNPYSILDYKSKLTAYIFISGYSFLFILHSTIVNIRKKIHNLKNN